MSPRLPREQFESLVAQALDSLPLAFRKRLDNVMVVVKGAPAQEVTAGLQGPGKRILGLYQGISQKRRGAFYTNATPDRIILYQENMEAMTRNRQELVNCVQEVVRHEIGHHFGLSDREMYEGEQGND